MSKLPPPRCHFASWLCLLCVLWALPCSATQPLSRAVTMGDAGVSQDPDTQPALHPVVGPSAPKRRLTVLLAPVWLAVGFVRIDTELRVTDWLGLKAVVAPFSDSLFFNYVLGAQVNFYPLGSFDRGWQIGIEHVQGRKHATGSLVGAGDADAPALVSKAGVEPFVEVALLGPHIGYKYITDSGLSVEAQVGVQAAWSKHFGGNPQMNSIARVVPVAQMDSVARIMPMFAFNFGWSL